MKPRPSAAAFTLVELLASSALLALLMLAAAVCLQAALGTSANFQRQSEFRRQMRVTVGALANDFRHAIVSADTPLLLSPPPGIAAAADGDAIFFFANHPASGKSELCAVGYYLDDRRRLRRYFRNSDATWQDADGHGGLLPSFSNPAAPLFPAAGSGHDDALLAGLASFRVRALRGDAEPVSESPLTVKPALLEIIIGVKWQNFTHEFIVNISGL